MEDVVRTKCERLSEILDSMGAVLVAYSGGVDSTFLAKYASDTLGRNSVLAVTASSDIYSSSQTVEACDIASHLDLRHLVVDTKELAREEFADNGVLRCYHCKQELFSKLFEIAVQYNLSGVVDGQNADDSRDFRPGAKASRELGIRSPLQEVGLTKDEIRSASKELGLPTWDKPAEPCLSTRIPYGTKITSGDLQRIESAEAFLSSFGVRQMRMRSHGDLVRIEVSREDFSLLIDPDISSRLVTYLKELGFKYVTMDIEGYRQGAMNEVLSKPQQKELADA